jgi:hypothetical protein
MPAFDLNTSLERAARRLGAQAKKPGRKSRSDRGATRVDPGVVSFLGRLLGGQERPPMSEILDALAAHCRSVGERTPSRATVYALMNRAPTKKLRVKDLPGPVRAALYNLADTSSVPAHQVAFYCFNYGDLAAVSFASSLPWLALYQARRLPGFRAKSRGLIDAVARDRGI